MTRLFALDARASVGLLAGAVAVTLAAFGGSKMLPGARASEAIPDQLVSNPAQALFDMEFDQQTAQLAWVDTTGRLWVSKVNPVNGDFEPPTGQLLQIDSSVATPDQKINGPEWGINSSGPYLTYTKNVGEVTQLASARFTGRKWVSSLLTNCDNCRGPFGNRLPQSSTTRIVYLKPKSGGSLGIFVRNIKDPNTEVALPADANQPRWVRDTNWLVYDREVNGVSQLFRYDTQTQEVVQLTNDSVPKKSPLLWQAPEYNNEYVLGAFINDQTSFGIWRQSGNNWRLVAKVRPPSDLRFLNSPEQFIYNGKSYVAVQLANSKNPNDLQPGEIWIFGIDPANPFTFQVSDPGANRIIQDPEVFIAEDGPFVYYADLTDGVSKIFKASTGLGPNQ